MTLPQDIAALAESIVNTLTQTDYQHVDKIDPASGKILWQALNLGQECYLSGKYIYTSSVNQGGIAMANGLAEALNAPRPEGPAYFHVHRLDPVDGKELWDFYRQEAPEELSFQQNRFLVRFSDRVQVWKFLTF